MSIFSKLKCALDERRLKRLRGDLLMIQKSMFEFNPFKTAIPKVLMDCETENIKLVENLVWYSADGDAIYDFYASGYPTIGSKINFRQSFFWAAAPAKQRRVHSGLASLISQKMSIILFGPNLDIKATVYDTDNLGQVTNSINQAKSTKANDMLKIFLEKINFSEVLDLSGQSESWSGHLAWKLNYDFSLSPYPILESYDRRYFEVVKKRKITTAIIFKEFFEKNEGKSKKKYVLEEKYGTNENGYATIENTLYELKKETEREMVPLTTLEETADLEELVTFKKTKGMLAFDKPNLLLSNSLSKFPYGKSDYHGAIASFDSVDEIVSEIVNEARQNKTRRYIPETMWQKDKEGNFIQMDEFVTNYFRTTYDPDNPTEQKITHSEFVDKTESHERKYEIFVSQACNNAGLSPISLGITGLESINSSDKSTRERSKTTLETRRAKTKLWKPFLEEVILQALAFQTELQSMPDYPKNPDAPMIEVEFKTTSVTATFTDYITESIDSKITTWGNAKSQNIASTKMAVSKIHENDLTEEEKDREVALIRFEQGMTADNPELLQLDLEEEGQGDGSQTT